MSKPSIHPFFWLVIPVLFIIIQFGIELFVPAQYMVAIHSEGGLHETLQSVCLLIAFILAVRGAIQVDWHTKKPVGIWFVLAAICTFYVSGEEISWGQHILNWDTPSYWAAVNDQNETNLHNTSAWLDQKPRLILFIGIVAGGLLVPALRRWKPSLLPAQFSWAYPSNLLIVPALGVLLPYTAQEIAEHIVHGGIFERVSEVQELYMYYFVILYFIDLHKREIS